MCFGRIWVSHRNLAKLLNLKAWGPLRWKSVVSNLFHSFRVQISIFSTRFECKFPSFPLVSSVTFSPKKRFKPYIHPPIIPPMRWRPWNCTSQIWKNSFYWRQTWRKWAWNSGVFRQNRSEIIFYTRNECGFISSTLASSVFSHLPHSFRVYFHIFPTRFECIFTSSPLVSSVVSVRSSRVWLMWLRSRHPPWRPKGRTANWRSRSSPLETSVVYHLLHSKRV